LSDRGCRGRCQTGRSRREKETSTAAIGRRRHAARYCLAVHFSTSRPSEGLLESNVKPIITNRRCRCQGGEIGRRARLRIAKSSISEPCFSLQFVTRFTRGKRLVSRKSSNSRMASRKRFDLAQILAHKRARLRLLSRNCNLPERAQSL
jgi:hypothetical protein